MTTETLKAVAGNPRTFLRRNYRTDEQIAVKQRRLRRLWDASVSITQTLKPVSVYTGPGDKIGDSASAIADLQAELQRDIQDLEQIQRETAEAISVLVPDINQRTVLEAYYLAHMRWEEIAFTMNYAYRWVMRLHQKALRTMQAEAKKRLEPVQNGELD